jgi:hypothetical protein
MAPNCLLKHRLLLSLSTSLRTEMVMLSPIAVHLAVRHTKQLSESALPNAPVVRPPSPTTHPRQGGMGRLRVATANALRLVADRVEPRRVVAAREWADC